jgi:dynein heavy chain 2
MMPVETIHDILSAVLRIFGNQDTSWNSMKKFIGQKGIIESIINYDPRNLNSDVRSNL